MNRFLAPFFAAGSLACALCALPLSARANPTLLPSTTDGQPAPVQQAKPLDRLVLDHLAPGSEVEVIDSAGHTYARGRSDTRFAFTVGGAAGRQTIAVHTADGARATLALDVDAKTDVQGDKETVDLFHMLRHGMASEFDGTKIGAQWVGDTVQWRNRTFYYLVTWVLDNHHNAKGMQYFTPHLRDFPELTALGQREDGMIWSFISQAHALPYYKTEYGPLGYIREIDGLQFVRQPSENHPEYNFVNTIHLVWKAGADDAWMKSLLSSAERALDYCVTDEARWSKRFQLLKRVYTIDSWDFQVDDEYTPQMGLAKTMVIDPKRSKFGVFFGDNVYYAAACDQLAEMMTRAGNTSGAEKFSRRGNEIRERLNALSWNGRFFRHFVDEDPSVKRNLGVDESTQIAQGNAYALNYHIREDQARAILATYKNLRDHLPPGSPGEWYAIYPPFGRGFEFHNAKWQYMNGGIGGHVAGELAKGAFAYGDDVYGRDILTRLRALAAKHGGKLYFAYTGAYEEPPKPVFTPVSLAQAANMSACVPGRDGKPAWLLSEKVGDDIHALPTGDQLFAGVPFQVAKGSDAAQVLGVSQRSPLPATASVAIGRKAGAVYLLHTATKPQSEGIVGVVHFNYTDGQRRTQFLISGKQLTYWWFPELKTERSGVAWRGANVHSAEVGLSWCAIDNPRPEAEIATLEFAPADSQGVYTVAAVTLSDQPHHVRAPEVSYGGPDNWANATTMAALVEGLIGIKNEGDSRAFQIATVSPRFDLSAATQFRTTLQLPISGAYVAYDYTNDPTARALTLRLTGSGEAVQLRLPLPAGAEKARALLIDGKPAANTVRVIGEGRYVEHRLALAGAHTVILQY
ncbi:hypothetical protein [Nibricoccus sp. IMCC34717]|uniref:hypothetical protein n=1 Tax=Nibricoccus sp. IMCC34717 TaxID=3034021 RepID=UPI00384C5028